MSDLSETRAQVVSPRVAERPPGRPFNRLATGSADACRSVEGVIGEQLF